MNLIQTKQRLAEADQNLNARLFLRDVEFQADCVSTSRMLKNLLFIGITVALGYAELYFILGAF